MGISAQNLSRFSEGVQAFSEGVQAELTAVVEERGSWSAVLYAVLTLHLALSLMLYGDCLLP